MFNEKAKPDFKQTQVFFSSLKIFTKRQILGISKVKETTILNLIEMAESSPKGQKKTVGKGKSAR